MRPWSHFDAIPIRIDCFSCPRVDHSVAHQGKRAGHQGEAQMNKRLLLSSAVAMALLSTGCTTTSSTDDDPAAKRASIDAGADKALTELYSHAPGSHELVSHAKGVLV